MTENKSSNRSKFKIRAKDSVRSKFKIRAKDSPLSNSQNEASRLRSIRLENSDDGLMTKAVVKSEEAVMVEDAPSKGDSLSMSKWKSIGTAPLARSSLDRLFSPFGKDVFKVEASTQATLLTSLMRVTTIENVVFKDGALIFTAPQKHRAEIIALLNNLCYNHTIISTRSIPLAILSVLKRTGLVIGLFCAVCVFCLYNSFILSIELSGECGNGVLDVLRNSGVIEGRFAPSLDVGKIERELLSIDGISFASVAKRGTRVYVRTAGEQPPDAYVGIGARNVTASFDGVVTRVVVFSGTAEVSAGDAVVEGQTLIGGYYLKGEDQIPVVPSGEVYAERTLTFERFFPDQYMTYSGRNKTYTRLCLFGKLSAPKSPYADYTLKTSRTSSGFLIPYVVTRWTYSEVCLVQCTMTDDEIKSVAYGEVVARNQFDKILSYHVAVEDIVGGRIAKIVLTVEERL